MANSVTPSSTVVDPSTANTQQVTATWADGVMQPTPETLNQAVSLWRQGDVVAFPTETVYGLGADASNSGAVAKIYAAKGRPSNHPLIVHGASWDTLKSWVEPQWLAQHQEMMTALTQLGWPGPLTLIVPKAAHVPLAVTGGQTTVGLRVPNHPVAQALLAQFQGGIAAPSANRFGRISPTTAQAVQEELGDRIPLIVDGGECMVGLESTIVDVSTGSPRVLRPGFLTSDDLNKVLRPLGLAVDSPKESGPSPSEESSIPRVPGALPQHYAPQTPLFLLNTDSLTAWLHQRGQWGGEGKAASTVVVCHSKGIQAFVEHLLQQQAQQQPQQNGVAHKSLKVVVLSEDAPNYARQMYGALRQADALQWEQILVENEMVSQSSNEVGLWTAITDRLLRASAPSQGKAPSP